MAETCDVCTVAASFAGQPLHERVLKAVGPDQKNPASSKKAGFLSSAACLVS